MGQIQRCSQGCYSWFKGYNQTISNLRQCYKRKYKDTIFYPTCLTFIEQLHRNTGTDDDKNYHSLKGSLLDSVHYQQQAINIKDYGENGGNINRDKLPGRLSSLNEHEKQQLITDLIKKSYIFLDISDIFTQQQTRSYEYQIKRKIFENDQSMMTESFISSLDGIADSLRKFDIFTIHKLESYVQMCEIIKKACELQSGSILSRLVINLKSRLIQNYNTDQSKNIQKLLHNTHILINILQVTILQLFDLNLKQEGQDPNQQHHEVYIQFLNQTNLYTLISSILFEDASFHGFFQQAILEKFRVQLNKFRQMSIMTDQYIVGKLLGQDGVSQVYFQPTIVGLFNKKSDKANYFDKTIKIFEKLPKKLQPVLKLKVLGQLQKQFLKQFKILCAQKSVEIVYDRMISQHMANWLINRDKVAGQKSIVSIILAYAFVHSVYRLGAKGSTILSFVETVEKILGWPIPTD